MKARSAMRWPILGVGLAAAASVLVGGHHAQHRDVVIRPPLPEPTRLAAAYARVPLGFEQNRGQTDRRVRFLSHGPGTALFLTRGGATLALGRGRAVSLHLEGTTGHQQLVGEGRLPGAVSYMLGNDRSRWRKGIATYSSVVYRDVYPGIA